jgi:hypothetical protein
MISLLIGLLIALLFVGLLAWIISLLPLPAPFGTYAQVILVIILFLVVISYLAPFAKFPPALW